ncbi:hypothetical protein ACHAWF_005326 [Thalassiosira exigua]
MPLPPSAPRSASAEPRSRRGQQNQTLTPPARVHGDSTVAIARPKSATEVRRRPDPERAPPPLHRFPRTPAGRHVARVDARRAPATPRPRRECDDGPKSRVPQDPPRRGQEPRRSDQKRRSEVSPIEAVEREGEGQVFPLPLGVGVHESAGIRVGSGRGGGIPPNRRRNDRRRLGHGGGAGRTGRRRRDARAQRLVLGGEEDSGGRRRASTELAVDVERERDRSHVGEAEGAAADGEETAEGSPRGEGGAEEDVEAHPAGQVREGERRELDVEAIGRLREERDGDQHVPRQIRGELNVEHYGCGCI